MAEQGSVNRRLPVLGFAAFSGTGKTSLLRRLIPLLTARGLQVAVVKMSHHDFEIDVPGKDSYELRHAGAQQVLITSPYRWALVKELSNRSAPDLWEMISRLDQSELDLVVVEGFRHWVFPKIEIHRLELGHPLLFPNDESIIAVACDGALPLRADMSLLDLNQPGQIADFVCTWLTRGSAIPLRD